MMFYTRTLWFLSGAKHKAAKKLAEWKCKICGHKMVTMPVSKSRYCVRCQIDKIPEEDLLAIIENGKK